MVSAARYEKLLQRLRDHGGDRPPRQPGMLPDRAREAGRHLDREHHRGLRDRDPARSRLIHIPPGLPRRAPEPAGQHPGRLSCRDAPLSQLRSRVDPLSMLATASATMYSHATNVLPDMSLTGRDTPRQLQPPAGGDDAAATLGSVSDLLRASVLVSGLCARAAGGREQAARKSPSKEDNRAACAAQSDAGSAPGATPALMSQLPVPQAEAAMSLLACLIARAAAAGTGDCDE